MTKEELIIRIKKLLALSDSSNPNEAAVALSRAQKLMQQYHIEMDDLEGSVICELEIEPERGMTKARYLSRIGDILTKVMGVDFVYITNQNGTVKKVHAIGPKDCLESCEYIFVILTRSVMAAKKLYNENIYWHILDFIFGNQELRKALSQNTFTRENLNHFEQSRDFFTGSSLGSKNLKVMVDATCVLDATFNFVFNKLKRELPDSFLFGYFNAVYDKVSEFVQDDKVQDSIEKYKAKNFSGLKISTTNVRRIHADAYSEGCEQGEKVNLMNAVHGHSQQKKLLNR